MASASGAAGPAAATIHVEQSIGPGCTRLSFRTLESMGRSIRIISVVDASGSMHCPLCKQPCEHHQTTSPISAINEAMVDHPPDAFTSCRDHVRLAFGSKVTTLDTGTRYPNMGRTLLAPPLNKTVELLDGTSDDVGTRVIFLTDGVGQDSPSELARALDQFAQSCKAHGVIVHLIGYSLDHDVTFMTLLVTKLTDMAVDYTYDYPKTPGELRDLIQAYSTDMTSFGKVEHVIKITTSTDETTTHTVSLMPLEPWVIHVRDLVKSVTIDGELVRVHEGPVLENVVTCELWVASMLEDISTANTPHDVQNIAQRLTDAFDQYIIRRPTLCVKTSKSIMTSIMEARRALNEQCLRLAQTTAREHHDRATMAHLTRDAADAAATHMANEHGIHRRLTTNRLASRLARQIMANATKDVLSDEEHKVAVAEAFLQYKLPLPTCVFDLMDPISCSSPYDAIEQGTCAVWSILVNVGPATFLAPETINVVAINPQILTLDTVKTLLARVTARDPTATGNPILLSNTDGLHACNACIPVFLHPEVWKCSSVFMDQAMAHACSGTFDGFRASQRVVVPLMLLEWLWRNGWNAGSEMQRFIFNDICNTCRAVDTTGATHVPVLLEELAVANALNRERLPSCLVVLAQCRLYDLPVPDALFYEEVRRRVRPGRKENRSPEYVTDVILSLFHGPTIAALDKELDYATLDSTLFLDHLVPTLRTINEPVLAEYYARLSTLVPHAPARLHLIEPAVIVWALDECLSATNVDCPSGPIDVDRIIRCRLAELIDTRKYMAMVSGGRSGFVDAVKHYLQSSTVIPPFVDPKDMDMITLTPIRYINSGCHVHAGSSRLGLFLQLCRSYHRKMVNGPGKLQFLLSFFTDSCPLSLKNKEPFLIGTEIKM